MLLMTLLCTNANKCINRHMFPLKNDQTSNIVICALCSNSIEFSRYQNISNLNYVFMKSRTISGSCSANSILYLGGYYTLCFLYLKKKEKIIR